MVDTCTAHPACLRDVTGMHPLLKPTTRSAYSTISTSPCSLEPSFFCAPAPFRSRIARLSLSSYEAMSAQNSADLRCKSRPTLRLVMTTLDGLMPTGTVAAFDFSMWTRSTWMTHFFR